MLGNCPFHGRKGVWPIFLPVNLGKDDTHQFLRSVNNGFSFAIFVVHDGGSEAMIIFRFPIIINGLGKDIMSRAIFEPKPCFEPYWPVEKEARQIRA